MLQIPASLSGGARALALGYGPHQCLGQTLARVEMEEAIGEFFHRFAAPRLAVPAGQLAYQGDGLVRGLRQLPVIW